MGYEPEEQPLIKGFQCTAETEWNELLLAGNGRKDKLVRLCSFWKVVVALKRAVFVFHSRCFPVLLGSGVLGDGLGSFADCVLGELPWQQETHRSLDLATADGCLLVVECQPRCL